MAQYTIIKLTNLTPLHIGTGKENYDFSSSELQSDTLSAALASICAQQGKNNDIPAFLESFVISSAFPFYDKRYFLPKAQGKINVAVDKKEEYEYRKKLKNVRFIEFPLWQQMIMGNAISIEEHQIQNEFIFVDGNMPDVIYASWVSQRVGVPRNEGKDAEPFFFDWKFFNKNAGLFCLTDATGTLLDEIVSLFSMLGESGLGTDKNVGGGKFDIETDTLDIENVEDPDSIMLLSLYTPKKEEVECLNLRESKYELQLRGGYISGSQEESLRHLRKKSVYMLGVGSVFPTLHPLQGKLLDLTPEWNDAKMHPVYRSGRPFYIPIKYNAL